MNGMRRVTSQGQPVYDTCGETSCDICFRWEVDRGPPAGAEAEARDLTVWTSADGRKTPITEMTDGHLANTIAYLERKIGQSFRAAWLPALRAERERRAARSAFTIAVPRREFTGEWTEAAPPNPFEGLVTPPGNSSRIAEGMAALQQLAAEAKERSLAVATRRQPIAAPLFEASRARAKRNLEAAAEFNDKAEARAKLRASLTGSGPKIRYPGPVPAPLLERAPQPASEAQEARVLTVDSILPPKGIPIDDIMDVLRENIVQYEERKTQRG